MSSRPWQDAGWLVEPEKAGEGQIGRTRVQWAETWDGERVRVQATRSVVRGRRQFAVAAEVAPEFLRDIGPLGCSQYLKTLVVELRRMIRETKGLGWFRPKRKWHALGGRRKGRGR